MKECLGITKKFTGKPSGESVRSNCYMITLLEAKNKKRRNK